MLDPFAGFYNTFRAYMLLPLHRLCVVSKKDHHPVKLGLQELISVFAKPVLKDSSDVTGIEEVSSPASTFVQAVALLRARNK